MKNNYKLQFINGGLKSYKVCCKTRLSGHYTPNPILGSAACKIQKHIQFTAALLLLALCSMSGAEVQAQNNVGIGTTTPNPKAVLELNSNDKGFLAPRMNTTFMNAIAPTATENALLIYNTDSACYHFYNGVAWKNLCQKGIDTALINKAIKNYLGSANFTTIINNAIVNNAIIDTSITNYANINNAVIDTSITNYANINNAIIDTSITNYANINNAIIDTSITNYANINNAVIDSSVTNYAQVGHLQGGWGSMDSLQIGGKNIMKTISDSIGAQAWLKKGNITNASNFIGTINTQDLVFKTNGIENMRILNTNGNVGIGTISPSAFLQMDRTINGDADIRIWNRDSTSNLAREIILLGQANGNKYAYLSHQNDSYNNIFYPNIKGGSTSLSSGGDLYFDIGGATNEFKIGTSNVSNNFMTILGNTGNVGIGTTNPTARLEVNSGVVATSGLKLTQLSGLISTSTSNYPTVLYNGSQMDINNFGFVYDRTNGVFYVTANAGGKTVRRSTSTFVFTTLTTTLQNYSTTSCLALDATGNVYARNNNDAGTSASNSIMKITTGNVISYIGSGIQSGTTLAVNATGDIYFNGNYYDPRIWKSTQGGVVTLFNGDLENYSDIQFDNSGVLYACGSGMIYKFTSAGVRSVFASNVSGVQSIKFDGTGQLYAGSNLGTIFKVSSLGVPTVYVAGVGNVAQIDFDASGNLLFVDYSSGILYTISNVTLASTTVLSVDNAGNVIPSSSNGISNSTNVYNNVPGSLTINGKLYVEEDKTLNPYSNEHIVNITNTSIDLGTQMIPYLAKYKMIRFVLPANSTFTWNVPIGLASFQYVSISGTGNSNLTNITSQINMTVNRTYSYAGTSYKDAARAYISSFAVLSFGGVFINHTHNDFLPIGTGGIPALFYLGGNSPTLSFSASIVNSADHISTGSNTINACVLNNYVNFTKNPGAPADIQFIDVLGSRWAHADNQNFIIHRHPGQGSTMGVGVLLDPSPKIKIQ